MKITRDKMIKEILSIHPSVGREIGLSWYFGGMLDSGEWYVDKIKKLKRSALLKHYQYIIKNNPKQDKIKWVEINGRNIFINENE